MADEHEDYGLVRPFHIDDEELCGVTIQQAFVLGYELAQVDELLKLPEAGYKVVRVENKDRIEAGCKLAGRNLRLNYMPADKSESWMELLIYPGEPVKW